MRSQLSYAALPTLGMFRAFVWSLFKPIEVSFFSKENENRVGYLSRTSWSIALIALWRRKLSSDTRLLFWFPAYFCDSALLPLRQMDVSIRFYEVNEDGSPDLHSCRNLLSEGKPDVFLLSHYWGKAVDVTSAANFCRQNDCWLIEDCAHALYLPNGAGRFGDFVLFSPYKHLPMPNGAIIVVRPNGVSKLAAEFFENVTKDASGWWKQLSQCEQSTCHGLWSTLLTDVVWLMKRSVQALNLGHRSIKPSNISAEFQTTPLVSPKVSPLASILLPGCVSLIPNVAFGKVAKNTLLNQIISRSDLNHLVSPSASSSVPDFVPYQAAYQCEPAVQQELVDHFSSLGLPIQTWPDLPKEVLNRKSSSAVTLRDTHVFIALHPNHDERVYLRTLISNLGEEQAVAVSLEWRSLNEVEWKNISISVEQSSILQAWSYGMAKNKSEGWKVSYGLFRHEGQLIGIVQCLTRKVCGLVEVCRINMGPVFCSKVSLPMLISAYQELGKLGDWRRLRFLRIAPPNYLGDLTSFAMAVSGFRVLNTKPRHSSVLDLSVPPAELMERFDSKWRNCLRKSQKLGVSVDCSRSMEAFQIAIDNESEQQRTKNYNGLSKSLFNAWSNYATASEEYLTFVATKDGVEIASACFSVHGNTGTYLLAWNSKQGRRFNANYLLLWTAIEKFNRAGLEWLDLGGLDYFHNRAVAEFKRGLNGSEYFTVGEYLKV